MIQSRIFISYPDAVRVEQLCKMLCIGRSTAYTLLRSGELKSVQIGKRYLIPVLWVEEYLERRKSDTAVNSAVAALPDQLQETGSERRIGDDRQCAE